jgi:hypothetical protein
MANPAVSTVERTVPFGMTNVEHGNYALLRLGGRREGELARTLLIVLMGGLPIFDFGASLLLIYK